MAQHAVEALSVFPRATRVLPRASWRRAPRTSASCGDGPLFGAPFRAAQALARRVAEWSGAAEPPPPPRDLHAELGRSLLEAANALRNRLVDDHLIVRVGEDDALYRAAREAARAAGRRGDEGEAPVGVEALGGGLYNLHVPVPQAVQREEQAL